MLRKLKSREERVEFKSGTAGEAMEEAISPITRTDLSFHCIKANGRGQIFTIHI